MRQRGVLPEPTWYGSPNNLLPKYLAFLRKHKLRYGRNPIADIVSEIRDYETMIRDNESNITYYRDRAAQTRADLAALNVHLARDDEAYEEAAQEILALPFVIASRVDVHGALVLLIRPDRADGVDVGDYQIDYGILRKDQSRATVTATRMPDGRRPWFQRMAYHSERTVCGINLTSYRLSVNSKRIRSDVDAFRMVQLFTYVNNQMKRLLLSNHNEWRVKAERSTLTQLWEGHVACAGDALRRLVELCVGSDDSRESMMQEISSYERGIRSARQRIDEYHRALRRKRAELAQLERDKERTRIDIDIAEAKRDLELITTGLPGVMGMRFERDGTPVVHIRSSWVYKGHRYDLGDYEFSLTKNRGQSSGYGVMPVRLTRMTANQRLSPYLSLYPSDTRENWFCFGGRSTEMHNVLANGEFGHLLNVAIHSINRINDYDRDVCVGRFPEIPLDEVWENRPRRRARRKKR